MVGSINNGFQPQIPVSNATKPQNLADQKPSDALRQDQNNQSSNINAQQGAQATQGTQSRPPPPPPPLATSNEQSLTASTNESSSANRGSQLDISV